MATITLNSLKCVKLQDSLSEDEIEVRINGTKVGGPYGVQRAAKSNSARPEVLRAPLASNSLSWTETPDPTI